MVKITLLYKQPISADEFERGWAKHKREHGGRMPGLRRIDRAIVKDTIDGSGSPYYRVIDLWFDDEEQLRAALASDIGRETFDDLPSFASGGYIGLISSSVEQVVVES
jgi:uncharacterized protein (TIGR02118 family)